MAHVIKKGSIKVPTQPKDFDLQATGLVFKSYDNQIALEFNVEQQNGTPADLLGANLRLLMFIYDEVDGMITKEPIPFITKNLITESFLNGHVKYILPEALKAYNGVVETYVYIEYPDGTTSDNIGFTFRMKRSEIDGLAQDKADYFIEDFQQLLDGVKQEATDAVNEALAKVEVVSKNVSSAQNDLTILEDRIDQTNQQIGDLGKLKKMYSNSIDFGDYDYSGNPNIAPNVGFNDFYNNGSQTGYTAKDEVDHIAVTRTADAPPAGKLLNLRTLLPNKTYTLSVDIWADAEVPSGAIQCEFRLKEGAEVRSVWALINKPVGTNRTTYSVTFTTAANFVTTEESRISLWFNGSAGACTCYVGYNIKIEEGSTATPYQPNLLDAPYYLSKIPLGENILKPASFPINTTEYMAANFTPNEPYVQGQKYTFTMKASKPSTQTFGIYLRAGSLPVGNMVPVEGLADVWQLTFEITQSHIDGSANALNVFQAPQSTKGTVNIEWAKLEKGDTRTPNIEQYKYRGIGMRDSNNPKDYVWDLAPEYVEDNLATNTTNISTNTTAISTLQNKNLFTQNKSTHGLTWIAHRGNNSTAPENSIVAFENVYRHQAIETDIQLTSDNRWVVMHDETVDRTTNGTGKISDMTYDQFRALRIDTGANIDKLTDDEKIPPNLEEFLLICKKNNRIPVVEIKATGGYTKEQLQLIKTISDGIGMTEKTIFISFNYDMLVLMREIFPFNELQWVYQGTINTDVITKLKTLGLPCGLDINENNASLTKDNVNLLHANRLKIGAWTVEYNSFEKMKDLGIDYITTNSPSGYLKYAELSLLNGFTPTNDNGQVPQFAAELEGGYVFLSFNVKDGANNNQLTEIAKLPDWAIPHEKQYNQCMIRTSSGVSLATFDTQGWKHSTGVTEGTITIGLGWSSRTTWAAGQCIYKID
ncbi:MAG: glycerophosphodiester phosphodiesterase family protein [Enterococcus faecium]|jgi:glycerophosphoryl diester phosphodiesterase